MKNREINIDLLRVVAMVMVVVLHLSASYVELRKSPQDTDFIIANILQSFTRVCVPIFILITGKYLINKKIDDLKNFYKNTFRRIVFPFLIWLVIYTVFQLVLSMKNHDKSAFEIVTDVFKGKIFYHLWYIYMIIPLYIVVPFLNKKIVSKNLKIITFSLISFGILHNALSYIFFDISFIWIFWFIDYLGLFYLGYYLSKEIPKQKGRPYLYGYLLVSIILSLTSYFFINKYDTDYWYTYLNPLIILSSAFILKFFLSLNIDSSLSKYIIRLSDNSYGIYLSHALVLEIMRYFQITRLTGNIIVDLAYSTIICIACSYFISIFIKRVLTKSRRNYE